MHFSCKITHAILSHLESEKIDLSAYFSEAELPWELLRDSSYWMRAPDMEAFLQRLSVIGEARGETLVKAGHKTAKNRVWGVLDSVLRMMPQPHEIFQQPGKFLSYFISPEPPIENLVRHQSGLSFDIPLPAEQYPLVTTYLKAAFESLPSYAGQSYANCQWQDIHFKIDWSSSQQSILTEETTTRNISPQLMQDVIRQLEHSGRELEEKNRELQRRNEELSRLAPPTAQSDQLRTAAAVVQQDFSQFEFMQNPVHQVAQNLSRLHDYMVRAHQLVTLLVAGQKQSAGIKQALHRVDWDIIKNQYPQLILESLETLKKLNKVENHVE